MDHHDMESWLNIIHLTANMPHLGAIRETATNELVQANAEYEAILRPPPEPEEPPPIEGDV